MLADIAIHKKEWKKGIKYLNKLLTMNVSFASTEYLKLANCYSHVGKLTKCKETVESGIALHPNDKKLWEKYVDIAIHEKEWLLAKQGLKIICSDESASMDRWIELSMTYQLMGEHENAQETFDYVLRYSDKVSEDEKGYRKLTIFDNGESRIEFYKKLKKTEQVIVTFDSINMEWQNPSFSFKLLASQRLDIVAVRKKKKQTYQQDLTQSDFLSCTTNLTSDYKDKVAYGFSLGAYNTLYFASLLECRILAISPRLSIHPIYGRTKIIPKYEFNQNISLPYNKNIAPIIVFDPKNNLDNRYVYEEVLSAFPNAKLIKTPYAGHGVAPHLSKTGQLKEFLLTVLNNKPPRYNRKLRVKSPRYYRLLADKCLQHNKPKWSLHLIDRSLAILPMEKLAIKTKIQALHAIKEYEVAVSYLRKSILKAPNILTYRNLLIDTYLLMERFRDADDELQLAFQQFGEMPSLYRRKKMLEKQFVSY